MCLNTTVPCTQQAGPFTATPRSDNLKMFKTLLFVASAVALATSAPADEAQDVKQAIVRLDGDGVTGSVTFTRQDDGKLRITGTVTGMAPGHYGFHIHETGDITKGCGSTGGHFNPNGKDHGHPQDANRHVGDLGNIEFDATKTAHIDFTDHEIKLNGKHNIIGRGLVLHGGTDDFGRTDHPDSKKTGNAGGRVACGVIGILEESPAKTNSAPASTSNILITISMCSLIALLFN